MFKSSRLKIIDVIELPCIIIAERTCLDPNLHLLGEYFRLGAIASFLTRSLP